MFLSLNKKIVYTTLLILITTSSIFVYSFYIIYLNRLLDQKDATFTRNSQYISTLYENILLRNELITILSQNKNIKNSDMAQFLLVENDDLDTKKEEASIQQQRTQELIRNYDEKYAAITEAIKVFTYSSILILFSIFIMWMLLNKWVLKPINRLSKFSQAVSNNNFLARLDLFPKPLITDEFYYLYKTFNKMLDNIENNIKEIKNKEEFLQLLTDAIPDGIRVIDDNFNIILANKQYYKQIEKNENQIMNKCYKSSQNFEAKCPKGIFTCPVQEIIFNKLPNTKTIQYFSNSSNTQYSINSAPLTTKIDNKEKKLIVQSIRDLSEDVRFSHQQKLSSVGFLATSVAHEMKNNLGAIRMITEGLLDKLEKNKTNNEEIEKYLKLINSQIIESISVPERLLKLAQINKDDLEIINVVDNINDIIKLLDYESKSRGIELKFKTNKNNIKINGTSNELKMMMINLIHNAFKATNKKGFIIIEVVSTKQNKIEISVTDNGHGIDKKDIKYIFDPFYSEGKTSPERGTGLGLPIVKSIVDKFGGSIKVTSKKGIGTTFTMSFPPIKKDLQN